MVPRYDDARLKGFESKWPASFPHRPSRKQLSPYAFYVVCFVLVGHYLSCSGSKPWIFRLSQYIYIHICTIYACCCVSDILCCSKRPSAPFKSTHTCKAPAQISSQQTTPWAQPYLALQFFWCQINSSRHPIPTAIGTHNTFAWTHQSTAPSLVLMALPLLLPIL